MNSKTAGHVFSITYTNPGITEYAVSISLQSIGMTQYRQYELNTKYILSITHSFHENTECLLVPQYNFQNNLVHFQYIYK